MINKNFMEKQLKLEVGKKYILRNGLTTGPLRTATNGTSYKFEANVKEPEHTTDSIRAWLPSGKFLTEGVDNKYDIIDVVD